MKTITVHPSWIEAGDILLDEEGTVSGQVEQVASVTGETGTIVKFNGRVPFSRVIGYLPNPMYKAEFALNLEYACVQVIRDSE